MITLNLSPIRSDNRRTVKWNQPILLVEDIITENGLLESNAYDLSLLPDGATAEHPVLGYVSRVGNGYECTLALYHGATAPYATRFPEPLVILVDGDVVLPLYNEPATEVIL